jgi:hypothetical protein
VVPVSRIFASTVLSRSSPLHFFLFVITDYLHCFLSALPLSLSLSCLFGERRQTPIATSVWPRGRRPATRSRYHCRWILMAPLLSLSLFLVLCPRHAPTFSRDRRSYTLLAFKKKR